MTNPSDLMQFATSVRQVEILEAFIKYGSQRKAAQAIGCSKTSVHQVLQMLEVKAAKQDPAQHQYNTKPVLEGFTIKGISQFVNSEGKVSGQWIKSNVDVAKQAELLKYTLQAMCEDVPRIAPIAAPTATFGNLCNVYTLTDSHVGMLAWNAETKSGDWDLTIAEATLVGCFEQMVKSSPMASTCVIAQLGDFLHYDSAVSAVTPLHGHVLDADGRMPKMVKTAIRVMRRVVDLALLRHDRVILLLAEGNHDISSSVWLRAMFQALYENEPRIEVVDSELPYYTYQHGNTMLAWHHGHLAKNEQLPMLFAAQFPKVWGSTEKRYVHTGHRHHTHEFTKELSGMTVTQHPTLAARDAYAARGGWIADRQVSSFTYSDKYGQVAKNTVTPEMIG